MRKMLGLAVVAALLPMASVQAQTKDSMPMKDGMHKEAMPAKDGMGKGHETAPMQHGMSGDKGQMKDDMHKDAMPMKREKKK